MVNLLLRGLGQLSPGLAARIMAELASLPRGRNPPQPWELGAGPDATEIEYLPGCHARDWGGPGPLVLALHGWRGRPSQFRPLAARLRERGCRLIALDLPGHGRTRGRRATPFILGCHLLAAARSLGPPHAVIGHSLGGAAIGAALAGGLAVGRVALVASPTRVSRLPLRFAREMGLQESVVTRLPALMDAHAGRACTELDLVASLPGHGAAALIVHDRDDPMIPWAEAEALLAAMPAAQLVATQGLGHRDLLADADVLARLADFLAAPQDGGPNIPA